MNSADILHRIANSLTAELSGNGTPKYLSLYNRILTAIEEGDWAPGEKLPAEAAFAQEIPLSLGTIQKALRMLTDDGILVRRHRDGTYVAGALSVEESTVYRFLADDGVSVLPVYIYVLDLHSTDEQGPWTDFLGDEREYVRIRRRVSINLEFEAHSEFYLPASRFPLFAGMTGNELHGVSLEKLLGERLNAPTLRTVQRMQVRTLPADACRIIGVEEGVVGMLWEIQTYTYRDLPVAYQRVYLPPNGRHLEVREIRR